MNPSENYSVMTCTVKTSSDDEETTDSVTDMAVSVRAVEKLLNHRFKNKKLLEEALTHPSYTDSASYQRLEFVGDAVLGLAISNYLFLTYPDLAEGDLTLLRGVNVSTEKLARVAVRHGLYRYVRRNAAALDENVMDFAIAVQQEDEIEVYGGAIKAPKILADIVESVAGAVHVDCGFDLQVLWETFRGLLEPIVTLDVLQLQPQPVTLLFELCHKNGKQVNIIIPPRKGEKIIASVYVDGQFVVSASSERKEIAKLHAAKAALQELSYKAADKISMDIVGYLNASGEIEGAKQKLHDLCKKKKWPKPKYRIDKEIGPAHERRFVCCVQIEIAEAVLVVAGDEKSRVKVAENSAASLMLLDLQDSKYL